MEKTFTKRETLNYLIENYGNDERVVKYATHEIELLDKKASSKTMTKTQIENENIKAQIVEILKGNDNAMSVKEIQAQIGVSNQKATALVTQLVKAEIVKKDTTGKVATYSI